MEQTDAKIKMRQSFTALCSKW